MASRALLRTAHAPRPSHGAHVALVALALLAFAGHSHGAPQRGAPPPVRLELYAMSQCPFTARVVEALQQVVADLGPDLRLSVDYIGQQSAAGELTSMHGEAEVVGDLAQICAARLAPLAYFRMMGCQSKNVREVATNWEPCARDAGVPLEPLRRCIKGPDGKKLLADSFARSTQRGVRGSPTLFIGGEQYQGGRTRQAFMRSLCAAAAEPKPAACRAIPAPPPVQVAILTDRRCPDCNIGLIEDRVRRSVANPVITVVDYADPVGRRLYAAIKPTTVPVIVLDSTIDADPDAAASLAQGARQVGKLKVVSVGRTWNPECADPGGCSAAACRDTLACRQQTPGTLELFMMSQCPFAARAVRALPDALRDLGSEAQLTVHYIGTGDRRTGLKSMHGEAEVQEDLRQVCAIKAYPKSFLRYLTCRAENPRSPDWQACTGGATGIGAERIAACVASGEGARLLERSFRVSEGVGVAASPTWIAGGRHKFSGIDAAAITQGFCTAHPTLQSCRAPSR